MQARRLLGTILVGTAALGGAPIAGAQTNGTATVRGLVFDSTSHEPLVDAAVFLWDTPYRGTTDAEGRFEITGIPAGEYSVLFFHTRLGEMGASVGPLAISLDEGDDVDVELATPSMFTLVATECLLEEHSPNTGTIAGWVGDGETGTGMPGAHVTLSWNVPDTGMPERINLRADAGGWYRTCNAPADIPITAAASFLDRQGLRREVSVSDNGASEAGFLLYHLFPTTVRGRLVDAETEEPVASANVWLRGTVFQDVTGSDGSFQLGGVPPGTYMLHAEHLVYGLKRDTLEVPSGETISVRMLLDEQPIEIAPLSVEVEAEPIERRARGGLTITRAQIQAVADRVQSVGDIVRLRNLPGVIVKEGRDGTQCIGYMPGQVRMMFNSGCVPMTIFINNVRTNADQLALQIPPDAIDRIEVYRPIEAGSLYGMGSGNGVMVIYTRNRGPGG